MKFSDKKENKTMKFVEILLLVISVVVFVLAMLLVKGIDSPMLDGYLGWTYILIAIALVFTLGFPLIGAFKNKKSLLKLILLIVAVVVVFGGAYLLAPGNAINVNTEASAGTFKFADAALYIVYLFVAAAFIALIWGAVHKAIKK
jgi:hypothetical protein